MTIKIFVNLTLFVPLSFVEGEGEEIKKRGSAPLKLSFYLGQIQPLREA